MERDNNHLPAEESRSEQFVDERTRDKIHKHIADPNSKITEQDIANVNTDIFKRPEEELTDEALKGDHPATESPDKPEPKAPNPWDILEEE
jgi:hypothetical protein